MEKKDRPYTVVPYDPNWVLIYGKEKEIISNVFGEIALRIEHIGSTSVEGIWAKPQVDILVIVEDSSQVDDLIKPMLAQGYNYHEDFLEFDEHYFTRDEPSGERTVSIHVRPKDNPESISPIYFRDYLRSHPEERDLYSEEKRRSYNEGKTDRVEYSKIKKEVLEQLKERAKKWYETINLSK